MLKIHPRRLPLLVLVLVLVVVCSFLAAEAAEADAAVSERLSYRL